MESCEKPKIIEMDGEWYFEWYFQGPTQMHTFIEKVED